MLEDNQALQRQLLQKHAKDLENLRVSFITLISIITNMNFFTNESMISSLNLALCDCVLYLLREGSSKQLGRLRIATF